MIYAWIQEVFFSAGLYQETALQDRDNKGADMTQEVLLTLRGLQFDQREEDYGGIHPAYEEQAEIQWEYVGTVQKWPGECTYGFSGE